MVFLGHAAAVSYAMFASTIKEILQSHAITKACLLDVFAIDNYRKDALPVHKYAVINRSRSTEQGSHWFLCYRESNTRYECFDSLGTTASFVQQNLLVVQSSCAFNTQRVQPLESDMCAAFCIYYISRRLADYECDFHEVMQICFSSDTAENEARVKEFMGIWTV